MNHTVNISFLETAIKLARMYGVAETLHPFNYISNDVFPQKIIDWTEEYMNSKREDDIVAFFEKKVEKQTE